MDAGQLRSVELLVKVNEVGQLGGPEIALGLGLRVESVHQRLGRVVLEHVQDLVGPVDHRGLIAVDGLRGDGVRCGLAVCASRHRQRKLGLPLHLAGDDRG